MMKRFLLILAMLGLVRPAAAQVTQRFQNVVVSGTLAVSGNVTMPTFTATLNQDAATGVTVNNNFNTANAQAYLGLQNVGQNVYWALVPSNWGGYHPGSARITGSNTSFDIESDGVLNFYTGGWDASHLRAGITGTGLGLGLAATSPSFPLQQQENSNVFNVEARFENTSSGGNAGSAWDLITGSTVFRVYTTSQAYTGDAQGPRIAFGSQSSTPLWILMGNGEAARFDTASNFLLQAPKVIAGSDDTTVLYGAVNHVIYTATITPASGGAGNCATQAAGFKANSVNADCVIATVPAGYKIIGVYADVTQGFTCSATCTGTKTFTLGTSAGGAQLLVSASVTALATFGLVDGDLGTSINRANAVQGGFINSWAASTTLTARFVSGTGSWGNASVTNVNAGSVKFFIETEKIK